MTNPSSLALLVVLAIALPHAAVAFGVGRTIPVAAARRPSPIPAGGASALGMSSPGSWENDDFLESLSGGGGGDQSDEGYGQAAEESGNVEPIVPGNHDMTDEEITMMAMRSAQFYNTDTSLEDVYGKPSDGPPSSQGEEEGEFQ